MFLRLSTIITSSRSIFTHLSWDSLQDAPMNCYLLHGDGNHHKVNYFPTKGCGSNYFSQREILHHVKLDYKKHCSVPLLSYVLAQDEPILSNTVCVHVLHYAPFKPSKVGMNVIIFPLTRSLHDLMSLSFLQPLLQL